MESNDVIKKPLGTYRSLNDDVTNGGLVQGFERCRALGESNFTEDDALIEVDSVVSNIAGTVSCAVENLWVWVLTRGTRKRPSRRGPLHVSTG